MIVVDTNIIAYLYLPTAQTTHAEQLLALDNAWAAPELWRSEFRNILAIHLRKGLVDFDSACQMQRQAETLMATNEYEVDSLSVLLAVEKSACSAYDCEFASLAQSLGTRLITADRRLLKAFPDCAMTAGGFVSSS